MFMASRALCKTNTVSSEHLKENIDRQEVEYMWKGPQGPIILQVAKSSIVTTLPT